jgi:hypothetical protein
MNGEALAGHAGENALPTLMPHEVGMLIAGLVVVVLALCVVLALALRHMFRLERRIVSLEAAAGHVESHTKINALE